MGVVQLGSVRTHAVRNRLSPAPTSIASLSNPGEPTHGPSSPGQKTSQRIELGLEPRASVGGGSRVST